MVWVLVGVRGCVAADAGHSLVTLLSLSMSVKDRPLHKTLGKSQTYYPEHILGYGCLEDLLLSCHGFWLFLDRKRDVLHCNSDHMFIFRCYIKLFITVII